ncbi:cyclophilin-like protein [Ascoidea rubescens DSM 1968]|uniref:Cyclophilin-like protein n=1 Tax=Ascoidea rubescens DSM 1968 TaxID=1344418 RepID=A0A1D2VMK2_9ASCO|nr:cyclophilin-like protein [Ascoidea rubescens DSM 1968]ODV62841.1 cyclophilin-like protein [Ascoidea rubescens DSM 1968]
MNEPPTTAKVVIETSRGLLEIELWAKETPINCQSFLEDCLNGRFDNLQFNKIYKNILVELNDNLKNNENKNKTYNEFHSRLKFNRRGLIGMYGRNYFTDGDDNNKNNCKFFITLDALSKFSNKNILIGKIEGESIYNLVKISESELREDNETPIYPTKIKKVNIIQPYFGSLENNIKKRKTMGNNNSNNTSQRKKKIKLKSKIKITYDIENENENDDELAIGINKKENKMKDKFKMKSAHETLNDKTLSKKKLSVKQLIEEKIKTENDNRKNSELIVADENITLKNESRKDNDNAESINIENNNEIVEASTDSTSILDDKNDKGKAKKSKKKLRKTLVELEREKYLKQQSKPLTNEEMLQKVTDFSAKLKENPAGSGDSGDSGSGSKEMGSGEDADYERFFHHRLVFR